jgi:hypothetical protein
MSELEVKQRTNVKFLVKIGKIENEIKEMSVLLYGNIAMKKTAVYNFRFMVPCISDDNNE